MSHRTARFPFARIRTSLPLAPPQLPPGAALTTAPTSAPASAPKLASVRRTLRIACIAVAIACAAAWPGSQPRAQSLPPAGVDPLSINALFRTVALSQGLVVGSPQWVGGGLEAFSGATGSHAAYGWRHDHLVNAAWARAVVSNYAARPAFYQAAPSRESGYYLGSRPTGWIDGEPNANPDGSQLVGTENVSGPDLEHFPLSPLFSIVRSTGLQVTTPGGSLVPAEFVAEAMVRYFMAAHAGMMRKPNGQLSDYVCSDRAARYFVGNLAEAIELGCINPEDAATMNDYVRERLLPHWTKLPDNDSAKGGDLQIYNGVCWAVPALYELALVTPPGAYRQEIYAALKLQCSKLALLAALIPGKACQVDHVDTWYGLTPAGITVINFEGPWEIRSMLVAANVLGMPQLKAEAMSEFSHWVNDKSQIAWLVDPEGNYLVPWTAPP